MIEWNKIKLSKVIVIEDDDMERLGIPKIIPDDEKHKDDIELWKYCNFYRHKKWNKKKKFMVSTFGRVLNVKSGKLCAISDSSGYSCTASGVKYKKVNICLEGKQTIYYIHNLVAHTFLKPKSKLKNVVVDHIDENPSHNYVWNLQFVTRSQNTNLHNMRVIENMKKNGIKIFSKDEEIVLKMLDKGGKVINTTFTDDEIRHICYMIADGHKATWIYNKLKEENPNDPKIEYERIRTLYKHIMGKRHSFKEIAKECGVVFPEESGINPYLKETGSIANTNNNK